MRRTEDADGPERGGDPRRPPNDDTMWAAWAVGWREWRIVGSDEPSVEGACLISVTTATVIDT
jgi:hypothetical protein